MDAMTQSNAPQLTMDQLYGPASLARTIQGYTNEDINRQFNQQNFQNNQNNLDTQTLNNLFAAQNNPTKLDQGNQDLVKTILANQGTALTNSENQQTSNSRVKATVAKNAYDLSDSELDTLGNHIVEGMLDDMKANKIAAANEKLSWLQHLGSVRTNRLAQDQRERDIAAAGNQTALQRTGMETQTQRETNAVNNATAIVNNQNTVEGRRYVADLNQKLDNRILQLQKIGTPEARAAADELVRTKQITQPTYAGAASLTTLSDPNKPLARGADVNNAPFSSSNLSNEDLIKLYTTPQKK
jgi:hypothetical protein